MVNYGKHKVYEEDAMAVLEVLNSDFLTTGPKVPEFEKCLKNYCGASYCTVVCNATAALHLVMLAYGIAQDDIVWTTPISFAATANAAMYVGAKVRFVDVNIETFNLSAQKLEEKLLNIQPNDYPKAIVFVHLAGNPSETAEVHRICKKYKIIFIEDASHSLGSMVGEQKTGACEFSDATVFSFHPVKMITTAEGGAVLTNSKKIDDRIKLLRSHGISRNHSNESFKDKPWYYEQTELGFNYRMSDLQAAIGVSQMSRLDSFVLQRRKLAKEYSARLKKTNVKLQKVEGGHLSSYHLFIVKFPKNETRDQVYNQLLSLQIKCNLHYIPIYRFPFYIKNYGNQTHRFPNAEQYFSTALTLPLFVDLPLQIVETVCEVIHECSKGSYK